MYRQRNPRPLGFDTDPATWEPHAACRGITDADPFTGVPGIDGTIDTFDDLDLSLLPDDLLAQLAAPVGRARSEAPPARGSATTADTPSYQALLETCTACPVAGNCLAWAMEQGIEIGIYGGLLPADREQLRRDRHLPRHGTRTGYSTHDCRCSLCTEANTIKIADRRKPISPRANAQAA